MTANAASSIRRLVTQEQAVRIKARLLTLSRKRANRCHIRYEDLLKLDDPLLQCVYLGYTMGLSAFQAKRPLNALALREIETIPAPQKAQSYECRAVWRACFLLFRLVCRQVDAPFSAVKAEAVNAALWAAP